MSDRLPTFGATAVAVLIGALLLYRMSGQDGSSLAGLERMVAELNQGLPAMADPGTRLDRVTFGDGEIVYEYKLVDYDANDLPGQQMERLLRPKLRSTACAAPMMKPLWKNGFSARYIYRGKDDRLITQIVVSPGDCGLVAVPKQ